MGFKHLKKKEINKLPKTSGVYAFLEGAKLLYIGKAANLQERVKRHLQQPKSLWERALLRQGYAGRIGFLKTNSEIEALILEASLIKKYLPKYNVVWKDDKSYFFVGITKEDFPRIFITHQKKENAKHIGPFIEGTSLKRTLTFLRKALPYYTAKKHPKDLCPWCHLNLCPGPNPVKSEYQKNIKNLISVLEGKSKTVLKILKREMKSASISQNFEKAAKTRDQIDSLERILSHAKIFKWLEENLITRSWQSYDVNVWSKIEKELKKILKIKGKISRIEAYDVSNIQGEEAVGSMVTFIDGRSDKNFYRKFKIRITGKPDDVAMLKEVLTRRFKHLEWPLPDAVLIDGGKPQLNAATLITKNYKLKTKVMALAKKKNELYAENQKKPTLLKTLPREIFNLILQLRDEAHRFAQSYHHKLRKKALLED